MLDKIFKIQFTGETIIVLLLISIFIIYKFYWRRINISFLRNIDFIIVGLILTIIYMLILDPKLSLFGYIIGIGGFFVGYLQYRKNKEYEIFSEYFNKGDINFNDFIGKIIVLSPILTDQKNFMQVIKKKIKEFISLDETKYDGDVKKDFSKILNINEGSGDYNLLGNLLKEIKIEYRNEKKQLKKATDIGLYNQYINRCDYLINLLESSINEIFKKQPFYVKIINFLKP